MVGRVIKSWTWGCCGNSIVHRAMLTAISPEAIEKIVVRNNLMREVRTPFHQGAHRVGDHLVRVVAHPQQHALQRAEFLIVMFDRMARLNHLDDAMDSQVIHVLLQEYCEPVKSA